MQIMVARAERGALPRIRARFGRNALGKRTKPTVQKRGVHATSLPFAPKHLDDLRVPRDNRTKLTTVLVVEPTAFVTTT